MNILSLKTLSPLSVRPLSFAGMQTVSSIMILSVLSRGVATKSTPTPKMSGATKSTVTKTTSQGSSNVVFVAPAVKKTPGSASKIGYSKIRFSMGSPLLGLLLGQLISIGLYFGKRLPLLGMIGKILKHYLGKTSF